MASGTAGLNQSQMLVPRAKPDETIWGHLHRVAALNNLNSVPRLMEKSSGEGGLLGRGMDSPLTAVRVLRMLASADLEEELPYAWRHGMGYMLVLSAHARIGARDTDYYARSALHEQAYVLPARRRAKFCQRCQLDAIEREGFVWFRRIHQVAGIEFCPSHHERLQERPANLQRPLSGSLTWGENTKSKLIRSVRISESDAAIQCYAELISWRWSDKGYAHLADMHDLVVDRAFTSGVSVGQVIRDAVTDLRARPRVRAWIDRHFQHLFSSSRQKWRPDISLIHLALALASQGDTMSELLVQLKKMRSERSAMRNSVYEALLPWPSGWRRLPEKVPDPRDSE